MVIQVRRLFTAIMNRAISTKGRMDITDRDILMTILTGIMNTEACEKYGKFCSLPT